MKKLSRKKLLLYKILAVIIVLFLVSFLRYYGGTKLFYANNGSIFEIAKIAFWAVLVYGLIEFLIPKFGEQDNIFFGKLAAIVAVPILVVIFMLIFPQGFTLSALSVALAVIIAQILEYHLAKIQPNCTSILVVTLLFLIFLVCFIIFTYHPLGGILFRR